MSCEHLPGNVWVCRSGYDAEEYTGREVSARHCFRCKRRLVHREVMLYSTTPSYYGPHFTWECPCGERRS